MKKKVQWKELNLYPEIEGIYLVSEYGEIKSKTRTVTVYSNERGTYKREYKERVLIVRRNKKNPHKYTSISKALDNGRTWVKTIYVHKIVAQLFLEPPMRKDKIYVEHLNDDFDNNHYSNLRWISHSQLVTRNFNERHPENKNLLRDLNIKSGYYNNIMLYRKIKPSVRIPYYELQGNSLVSNFTGKRANIFADSLVEIYSEYKHLLVSPFQFKFKRLTPQQRLEIKSKIPNRYITNIKDYYEKLQTREAN